MIGSSEPESGDVSCSGRFRSGGFEAIQHLGHPSPADAEKSGECCAVCELA